MANTIPDSWTEVCLVSAWNGSVMVNIAALIQPSEMIELGDREYEFKPNIAGGRTGMRKPEEDTMITFDGEFVGIGDADDTSPDGMISHFYEGTVATTPFTVNNYSQVLQTRNKWQLFFLWSDDSTVSAATGAVVSGANALRCRCTEARFVSCKPSFTENELRFKFKWRVPARSKAGSSTILWESADGLAAMTSLGTVAVT